MDPRMGVCVWGGVGVLGMVVVHVVCKDPRWVGRVHDI